ncbi:MAG: hypothetical protein JO261_08950 [Alphaproteobacteria bacterium]|nr:hypothetical protein [Alphaproteobacteria bacterium]MBV9693816.1 hypothetical protein [Alphaproteobacteria bacterium]
MRFLCILAAARTGSTRLNRILNSTGLNTKSELFHPHARGDLAPREVEALAAASNGAVHDAEAYIAWRRQNPLATLNALQGVRRKRILAFKVFPGHLEREGLQALLAADDIAYAILRRRPIDCFISQEKAQIVGKHRGIDTTAIKPELSPESFVGWAKWHKGWFKKMRTALVERGKPFAELSYERHIEGRTGRQTLEAILPLLEACGLPPLGVVAEPDDIPRQDNEPDYRLRVANWESFAQALRADPADALLLEWAQTVP